MRGENIRYPSIFIYCVSLVKAAMGCSALSKLRIESLTGICHCAMLLTKRLYFLTFQLPKAEQRPLRTSELVA
jgi:hypothetical protein